MHIWYRDAKIIIVEARLYPNPPTITSQAKLGFILVSHQDAISIIRNRNGVKISNDLTIELKPVAKLKINPTKKKIKAIPNK